MSLDQMYLSRNELIARLVGYSSRATPIFTGLLKVVLSGYSSSKYNLGLIRGAIVYAEGKRGEVSLYGGSALRNLLEELSNPSVTGRVDFIEMRRYEVETKISGNPLIALELPVYFGDLVTLIPGYQTLGEQPSSTPARIIAREVKKGFSIVKKIRKRSRKVKVKFIRDRELLDKYSEFLSSYHEHLLRKTKPLGILTASSVADLLELLSKYGKQKQIIIAKISTSDETVSCMALIIDDRIAGIYCDNMGITITNRKAVEFLVRQKTGYTVELRRLVFNDLCREMKRRVLYALDHLKGYYTGLLELEESKVKYYIVISNKRIVRIGGSLYINNAKEKINRVLALHILPYILASEKNMLKTVNREDVDVPWYRVSDEEWKYATSIAKLLIENNYIL